jgi:hypothetical protein
MRGRAWSRTRYFGALCALVPPYMRGISPRQNLPEQV